MSNKIETLIIGGGLAGLATSYFPLDKLRNISCSNKPRKPGMPGAIDRWDSFILLTPNSSHPKSRKEPRAGHRSF